MAFKNQNIKVINKYFDTRLKELKENIQLLDAPISELKTELSKWYHEWLSNPEDSENEAFCKTPIREYGERLKTLKSQRKCYIQQYVELKRAKKTMQRAIEERWMNGFSDGVDFSREAYY